MKKKLKKADLIESYIIIGLVVIAEVLGILLLTDCLKVRENSMLSSHTFGLILIFLGIGALIVALYIVFRYNHQKD